MKTWKTGNILKGQKYFTGHDVSLSSLYLSGNWIELNQLIYFIEQQHSLEKLHVRGSFFDFRTDLREEFDAPFPEHSPRQLSFRTDFNLILSTIVQK